MSADVIPADFLGGRCSATAGRSGDRLRRGAGEKLVALISGLGEPFSFFDIGWEAKSDTRVTGEV